jgi:hypothetical protein
MRRFLAVVLSCVLLLMSSGFATSLNRFEHRKFLTPHPPAHPAEAARPAKGGRAKNASSTGASPTGAKKASGNRARL